MPTHVPISVLIVSVIGSNVRECTAGIIGTQWTVTTCRDAAIK
jgi:hypothetical protein